MTVIKLDTFTAGANTPLENHVSDSGGGWQGADVDHFDVIAATDDLQRDGTGPTTVQFVGDEGPTETDYFAEVTGVLGVVDGGNHGIGVVVRGNQGAGHDRTTSNAYAFWIRDAIGGWRLERVNAGAPNNLQTDGGYIAAEGIGGATVLKLKLEVTGQGVNTNLKGYIDPDGGGYQLVLDFDDDGGAAIDAAGNPGIIVQGGTFAITSFNAEDFVVPATAKYSTIFRRRR